MFNRGLSAVVDDLAMCEDRPIEIPRQKPMEECVTLDASVAHQQPE
jgi:hypothetical protein